jgi:hypothetical protein
LPSANPRIGTAGQTFPAMVEAAITASTTHFSA